MHLKRCAMMGGWERLSSIGMALFKDVSAANHGEGHCLTQARQGRQFFLYPASRQTAKSQPCVLRILEIDLLVDVASKVIGKKDRSRPCRSVA